MSDMKKLGFGPRNIARDCLIGGFIMGIGAGFGIAQFDVVKNFVANGRSIGLQEKHSVQASVHTASYKNTKNAKRLHL